MRVSVCACVCLCVYMCVCVCARVHMCEYAWVCVCVYSKQSASHIPAESWAGWRCNPWLWRRAPAHHTARSGPGWAATSALLSLQPYTHTHTHRHLQNVIIHSLLPFPHQSGTIKRKLKSTVHVTRSFLPVLHSGMKGLALAAILCAK